MNRWNHQIIPKGSGFRGPREPASRAFKIAVSGENHIMRQNIVPIRGAIRFVAKSVPPIVEKYIL